MISEHLAGSVVSDSMSHRFFSFSLKTAPRATLTGKHISGWRPGPVFRSSQTPSICLPGQIGTFAVYSLHHILHPAWVPAFHSSPHHHHPAHAYKNSPACLGQARPSDLSEGDFYGLFPTTDGYLAGITPSQRDLLL